MFIHNISIKFNNVQKWNKNILPDLGRLTDTHWPSESSAVVGNGCDPSS